MVSVVALRTACNRSLFAGSYATIYTIRRRREVEDLANGSHPKSDASDRPQGHEKLLEVVIEGVDELAAYTGKRPIQCFTIKMPFPLYLKFKALNKQVKDAAAEADKEKYTMTAWVNSAVDKVILPALEELLREAEEKLQPETVA
jgi:hypothetical protein